MINILFLTILTLVPAVILFIGFKILPKERWQIIGALPIKKAENDSWLGLNLTYYGLFNAIACSFSVLLLFVLLGTVGIPVSVILFIVFSIFSVCLPASKAMAWLVEKKAATRTIGGASFIGFLLLPVGLWLARTMAADGFLTHLPAKGILSSVSIAYVFGESFGRLACISFGCCYGKKMQDVHPALRWLFNNFGFEFAGKTKKIAYAHGLEGEKVFPIQALTAIIYLLIGVSGVHFFLQGQYTTAFLWTVIPSQLWRYLSEFLRADYRGAFKVSAYQLMSLAIIIYTIPVSLILIDPTAPVPNLINGLKILWDPIVIIGIQGIFITVFLYTGCSHVTYARMSFFVSDDKI